MRPAIDEADNDNDGIAVVAPLLVEDSPSRELYADLTINRCPLMTCSTTFDCSLIFLR